MCQCCGTVVTSHRSEVRKKQQQEDTLQRILQEMVAAEEISVGAAAVLSERDGGAHIKRS